MFSEELCFAHSIFPVYKSLNGRSPTYKISSISVKYHFLSQTLLTLSCFLYDRYTNKDE